MRGRARGRRDARTGRAIDWSESLRFDLLPVLDLVVTRLGPPGGDFGVARRLGRWDPERRTPTNALVCQGAIALALVGLGAATRNGFETMVEYTAPVFWLFFLLTGRPAFPHHTGLVRDRPLPVVEDAVGRDHAAAEIRRRDQ